MSPSTRSILSKFMGFVKPTNYLHGLIRGENMELGLDSDTGGQVKYVRFKLLDLPYNHVMRSTVQLQVVGRNWGW
ncbi:hypothetical protein L2E82_26548 [Cichorium intybus]|uniref:Uncharacterized protein n=1 Tax=Cichorium intybus TaxID=13427 RepID=A0ACB9CQM2_CICIN|nr:hypothetical protein L2E82_26548 [Cichorium intybus]